MSDNPTHTGQARHAWREIDRGQVPKRSAEERITDFHEIYSLFDEATIRAQASRCVQCASPACVTGCPLSNRIPEWLGLAAEEIFKKRRKFPARRATCRKSAHGCVRRSGFARGACVVPGPAGAICIRCHREVHQRIRAGSRCGANHSKQRRTANAWPWSGRARADSLRGRTFETWLRGNHF